MLSRREMLALSAASVCPACLRLAPAADHPTDVLGGKPTDARLGPPKTLNGYFPFTPPKTKEEWAERRRKVREQLLVARASGRCRRRRRWNRSSTARSSATGTPSRRSTSRRCRGTTSPATCTGRRRRRERRAARGPVRPRPLGRRPLPRRRGQGRRGIGQVRRRAGPGPRPVLHAGDPDPTRPDGLRRLPLRHGRLRRQHGHPAPRGVQGRRGRAASAIGDGPADLEQHPRPRLPQRAARTSTRSGSASPAPPAAARRRSCSAPSTTGRRRRSRRSWSPRPCRAAASARTASHLRVGTGNVEMAGLFAPKPLAMSAANDWTKEIVTKGFPELKQLYKLLGAEDNVAAKAWLEYGHNYNRHAREFMYAWFDKHLLGKEEAVAEKPYKPTPPKELSVYDAEHPRPKDELAADEAPRADDGRVRRADGEAGPDGREDAGRVPQGRRHRPAGDGRTTSCRRRSPSARGRWRRRSTG